MRRRLLIVLPIIAVAIGVVVFVLVRSIPTEKPVAESESQSSRYNESPMLRERVERGELPPVDERLPDEPLVVTPIEGVGRYDSEPVESESP